MSPKRPTIALFTTGGTISSVSQRKEGYLPALTGADLLSRTQGYEEIANVEVKDFSLVGSHDVTPKIVCSLAKEILKELRSSKLAGAVITHGTATLEESAFLFDLFTYKKPIVFTGAVAPADSTAWDGGRNLLDSIATAASPEAKDRGVLVCFDGAIHSAHRVVKLGETAGGVFASPGQGPVGHIRNSKVTFTSPPDARVVLKRLAIDSSVEVLKVCQGSNTSLLLAAMKLGLRGIVLEGLSGGGSLPSPYLPIIRNGLSDHVFVLSTRSLEGTVKYEGPADMIALGETGIISAGAIPSHKARLLLMAALGQSSDPRQVRELFTAYNSR